MKNQKGFSLIELLLVVGVILIISAIAVPSFLRSRMRANEGSAVVSIRTIDAAAATACLIDDSLAQGAKSGYAFVWAGDGATPSVSFTVTGAPLAAGSTGQSMYCSDQTAVIRFEFSGSGCTSASPPIQ
jgi:prepilin-type N-terminal cleavage/methylation domain-containing protein